MAKRLLTGNHNCQLSIINSQLKTIPPIIQVGDVLLSSEILTEKFCCDLSVCKGECCVEGDAGAPVTMDEIAAIEECVDAVWDDLSASAQAIIDKRGVAYTDQEGDLVTSIVGGKDCVFTYYGDIEDWAQQRPLFHAAFSSQTGKASPKPCTSKDTRNIRWKTALSPTLILPGASPTASTFTPVARETQRR